MWKLTPIAQSAIEADKSELEEGPLYDWISEQSCGDGFWYGLTEGGYIDPSQIIGDKAQLEKLEKAIELVKSFESIWRDCSFEY
jgi:hypothetical protein